MQQHSFLQNATWINHPNPSRERSSDAIIAASSAPKRACVARRFWAACYWSTERRLAKIASLLLYLEHLARLQHGRSQRLQCIATSQSYPYWIPTVNRSSATNVGQSITTLVAVRPRFPGCNSDRYHSEQVPALTIVHAVATAKSSNRPLPVTAQWQ